MDNKSLPRVSVIVPVYNGEDSLPRLIESLKRLDYPGELLEVIIVDNNSADNTARLIKESGFAYIFEDRAQSSYAARNKGIEHASGEILAFTDDDCGVSPRWVAEGVKALLDNDADMAAGHWEWDIETPTLSALYAKATFGNQKQMVEIHGAAATANFFAKKSVFEKMGPFDERIAYGGDSHFTIEASRAGHKIVYSREAFITHKAHNEIKSLWKKWWRTGFGTSLKKYYLGQGEYEFKRVGWYLPGIKKLKEFMSAEHLPAHKIPAAFFMVWLCKIAFAKGSLDGYRSVKNRERGNG